MTSGPNSNLPHPEAFGQLVERAVVGIFRSSFEGRYLMANQALARMFGYDSSDDLTATVTDIGTQLYVMPQQRAEILDRLASHEAMLEFECECLRKDGSRVWVRQDSRAVRDESGRLMYFEGFIQDITDQKRQEAERRLGEFALSRASVASYLIDPDARILRVNQANCEMLGYTEEELTRMTVHDVNPEFPVEVWPAHWRHLRANKQMRFKLILRHKDGHTFPVEIEINYLAFEGHEYNFAFVRDITERKRLEEQLRQSQKLEAIGRLAGGVAHDFNNMLTVINGYAEFLLAGRHATDPLREPLAAILDAGERAAGLTNQLLAFSRKAIIEPKILDLNQAAESAVRMLRRLIGEDVQFVTDLAPNLARVRIDPVQLEQLLMNLAVNARDAMPRGGLLAITTASVELSNGSLADSGAIPAGHYVQLTVSDTGEGMSESVKMQIFEPFFTTKGVGKGTGLGLSTVYGIVSQAGGAVSVESEVGKGTSFQILFPAVGEPAPTDNAASDRPAVRGKETILIAEDDVSVRQLSRLALEMQGYTVIEAGSGEAAMRAAASHSGPIHLLVTDVVMPDGGGRQLADMIRSTRPGVAVLYVSGYMDDAIVRHGIEDSTDAFLQKPFTPASLARKVREVIDAAPGV